MNQEELKQRLIELLDSVGHDYDEYVDSCHEDGMSPYESFEEFAAPYLIANGVTIQKWIPASEPPKEYRDEYGELLVFLCCEEGTRYPFRAMYDGKTWGDGCYAIQVKWWMPLPQAPETEKGDEGK